MTDLPALVALTPTQHATLLEALDDAYDYRIGSAPGLNDDNLERAEDRDVKARYEELRALVEPRPLYVADTDTASPTPDPRVSTIHLADGSTGVSLLVPMGTITTVNVHDRGRALTKTTTPDMPPVAVGMTASRARQLAAALTRQADEIDPDTDTAPRTERKAAPRRCEAHARRGTGTGICDRPLDVHGGCDRAADHLD